jgi:hypothetical protein
LLLKAIAKSKGKIIALEGNAICVLLLFAVAIVGRAITKGGAIEKSPILLSQYWNLSNKPI